MRGMGGKRLATNQHGLADKPRNLRVHLVLAGENVDRPRALEAIGVEGQGWFLGIHCFTKCVKVAFFRGTSLRPVPPAKSKSKDTRYLDIHEDDQRDEAQLAAWVRQASRLPGERM